MNNAESTSELGHKYKSNKDQNSDISSKEEKRCGGFVWAFSQYGKMWLRQNAKCKSVPNICITPVHISYHLFHSQINMSSTQSLLYEE